MKQHVLDLSRKRLGVWTPASSPGLAITPSQTVPSILGGVSCEGRGRAAACWKAMALIMLVMQR